MLPRPPAIEPTTASGAPSVIFFTSAITVRFVAAPMRSFPSCVRVMPVGDDGKATTRTCSILPPDRFSTAMPEFAPRPASDTKTQQPSFDGATINGGAGRDIVTDGEAAGALQSPDWACAVREAVVRATTQTILRNMRRLYSFQ